MTISFDGQRLSYVGDNGAFSIYLNEPPDKSTMRALMGCVDAKSSAEALAECEQVLKLAREGGL